MVSEQERARVKINYITAFDRVAEVLGYDFANSSAGKIIVERFKNTLSMGYLVRIRKINGIPCVGIVKEKS